MEGGWLPGWAEGPKMVLELGVLLVLYHTSMDMQMQMEIMQSHSHSHTLHGLPQSLHRIEEYCLAAAG